MHGLSQKLTQESVAALRPDGSDRIVFDDQVSGFGVRITPNGRKIFVAQGRLAKRPIRMTIGYADNMKVAAARNEAIDALAKIGKGIDPRQGRYLPGSPNRTPELTVGEFAATFLEEHAAKLKPRTADDYKRIVDDKIKPKFGGRPITALSRAEVSAWHAEMATTPRRANYIVAVLRKLMSYAETLGKRAPGTNPAKGITMFREGQRERFLSPEEIGKAADAITAGEAAGEIGPFAAAGLRLALLTGARAGEITAMKWEHVNADRRLVVLPDSKTGKRVIYLSETAWAVVEGLPNVGDYLIAGATKDAPYARLSNAWIRVRDRAGLGEVRLHDLRHTFASVAAGKGLSLPMIGKLLGHRVPATTARYAHLATDPVIALNDDIGEAFAAAMKPTKVVKFAGKKAKPS